MRPCHNASSVEYSPPCILLIVVLRLESPSNTGSEITGYSLNRSVSSFKCSGVFLPVSVCPRSCQATSCGNDCATRSDNV